MVGTSKGYNMIHDDTDMSVILPGRIVSYYPANQTADITISAEKIFSNTEGKEQLSTRQMLVGVPVHTPYGGGWSLTFPIKTGDTCLIVFSQIGYDHWFYQDKDLGGTVESMPVPPLKRKFSEDDGFAMVGFNTIPRKIQSYHATHSQWRNDIADQVISLNDDKSITITSPVSVTINAPDVNVNCETADITASTKTTIDTPLTEITGNLLMVNGNFTMTNGIFTGQGVNFNNHIHSQGSDSNGDAEVDTGSPHN